MFYTDEVSIVSLTVRSSLTLQHVYMYIVDAHIVDVHSVNMYIVDVHSVK